jgi:hypothetical protein
MALAKPAFGHNVDMHPEEVLDRVRKPNEREQALSSWHRDQQVEVTPGKIIAASDRPEHAWILHSKVVRQTPDLVPVCCQS